MRSLMTDTLYQWGTLTSRIVFALLFWPLAALLYPAGSIGIAAGAFAAVTLIGHVSHLGGGYGLGLLLPQNRFAPARIINTVLTVIFSVSVLILLVSYATMPLWGQELLRIRSSPVILLVSLPIVPLISFQAVQGITLLTLKRVAYQFSGAVLSGLLTILLLILWLPSGNILGVTGALVIGTAVGYNLPFFLGIRRALPSYWPFPTLDFPILRVLTRFSVANYIAALFFWASLSLIPLIVLANVGAEQGAYFAIPWSIGTYFMVGVESLGMVTFSRLTRREGSTRSVILATFSIAGLLALGVVAAAFIGGQFALRILFGEAYALYGTTVLRWMALVSLPVSLVLPYQFYARARGDIRGLISTSAITGGSTIVALWFVPVMGIAGGAASLCVGYSAAALVVGSTWGIASLRRRVTP